MKRFCQSLFLFLIFAVVTYANPSGYVPIVRNYTVADYSGGRQNWSLAQSADGLIYVGNNTNLLEFDGNVWKNYPLPDKDLVRSVYVSDDQRVYCGAYEEFGYFEITPSHAKYCSLSDIFEQSEIQNEEIWNIVSCDGNIIFQSFTSLFVYDGTDVTMIRDVHSLNLFNVAGELYMQKIEGDFVTLEITAEGGVKMEPVKALPALQGPIVAALPYGDDVMLLTNSGSGYILADGNVRRWNSEAVDFLKTAQVNRAVATKDGHYIIGTISGGVCSIDSEGQLEWSLDVSDGLQNNTVLGLLCDADDNIWVALDDGISFIDRTSGISVYRPGDQTAGMIYDMLADGEVTYMATNQGLYIQKGGKQSIVPGLDGQTWFITRINGSLYCGHNTGIYRIKGQKAEKITDVGGGAFSIRTMQNNGETWAAVGTYALPAMYRIDFNGNWEYVPVLENVRQLVKNLEYNGQGNIWCEHFKGGLVKLEMSPDFRQLEEEIEISELGEVRDTVFNVMKVNGRVLFSNGRGFYIHDNLSDEMIPYEEMNAAFAGIGNIHQAEYVSDACYWFVSDRMAVLADCGKEGFRIIRKIPFSYFGVSVEERASIVLDPVSGDSYLLLCNMVARIDMDKIFLPDSNPDRSISVLEVVAKDREGDMISLPLTDGVKVKSRYNTLSFKVRYPVYDDLDLSFRYRLKGLSEVWTKTGSLCVQDFQRLRAGKYTFSAEVISDGESISSTSFDFVVLLPWFLSWWMITLYVMCILMILLLIQSIMVKKIRMSDLKRMDDLEKQLLEQREAQLEAELRQKSKDLAGMSMAMIAHNEVLDSILNEVQRQKVSKSAVSLDKISHIIQNSIVSNQEQWAMFQSNFDCIHENFFKGLKEKYPDLTSTDLRLCALLRLNMSTKDIANMLNLTVRGVESARYRLRKKLDIPAEAGLVDFMLNFK